MAPRRSAEPGKADKRKQRALNSCLPCRQRKVKCDQHRPCSKCVERKSVADCISTPARANDVPNSATSVSHTSPASSSDPTSSSRPRSIQIASPTAKVHEDIIRPTIESDASEKPSMLYADDDPESVLQTEYSRSDIMELWQTYQGRIQLLNPMLLEPSRVEEWMCQLTLPTPELTVQGSSKIRMDRLPDYLPSHPPAARALLLAVLASASQFASKPHLRRKVTQRSLLTLAFRAVRKCNYLRSPSMDMVQSLILIGFVLQNDRACQASWCLLGTTIRLAEVIGVHQGLWPGAASGPDLARDLRSQLLYRVAQQDGMLSMCLGRNPTVWLRGLPDLVPGKPVSHHESMVLLNARMGTTIWELQSRQPNDFEQLSRRVHLDAKFVQHLSEKLALAPVSFNSTCLSTAFGMHAAFVVSYLCRPALKFTAYNRAQETHRIQVLELCKTNLVAALKHYVYLTGAWEFTIRQFAIAHSGLGAALMLGTLGEFKEDSIRQLAGAVIETLETRLEDVAIVSKGSKALDLLKSLYDEATGALRHDPRPPTLRVNNTAAADSRARTSTPLQGQLQPGLELSTANGIMDGGNQLQVPDQSFEAPFLYEFAEPAALEEFDSLFTDVAPFYWDTWDDIAY